MIVIIVVVVVIVVVVGVDVVDHIGCQGDGAHGEVEEGERAEKFCSFDQNLILII